MVDFQDIKRHQELYHEKMNLKYQILTILLLSGNISCNSDDCLTYSLHNIVETKKSYYKLEVQRHNQILQIIEFNSSLVLDSSFINKRDWNFDGNLDLDIIREQGTGGNLYNVWLLNSEKDSLIYNPTLSSLMSPELDNTLKVIISTYNGGWDKEIKERFSFQNGNFVSDYHVISTKWYQRLVDEWVVWEKKERFLNDNNIQVDSFIISSWPDSIMSEKDQIYYKWGQRKN